MYCPNWGGGPSSNFLASTKCIQEDRAESVISEVGRGSLEPNNGRLTLSRNAGEQGRGCLGMRLIPVATGSGVRLTKWWFDMGMQVKPVRRKMARVDQGKEQQLAGGENVMFDGREMLNCRNPSSWCYWANHLSSSETPATEAKSAKTEI